MLLDLAGSLPIPVLGAADFWLTKWVTPLWLLGTGVAFGLVGLGIWLLLLKVLSAIPIFGYLQQDRKKAHIVSLVLSLVIACGLYVAAWPLVETGEQRVAMTDNGESFLSVLMRPNDEQVLVGIATLLLSMVIGWGFIFGAMPKNARENVRSVTDGVGTYLLWSGFAWVAIALVTSFLVDEPLNSLASVRDLFTTGRIHGEFPVEAGDAGKPVDEAPLKLLALRYDPKLVASISVTSDRAILLADAESSEKFEYAPRKIEANTTVVWNRGDSEQPPISLAEGASVYAQNLERDPAIVKFDLLTVPPIRESAMIVIAAFSVLMIGVCLTAQQSIAPRLSAVALATTKSELAQPLFSVLMGIGTAAIILFIFLPFYTFGEDTKSLKENGLTVILVLAIFQGIWAASSSVAEEIEGRTALTVLSKPINRRSFVIGKFMGIFWLLMLMFVVLGSLELIVVSYKPLFEARESGDSQPVWQVCFMEMSGTIPGLVMYFMQAVILAAISVAVSTRLPQMANFAICFGIYLVGNLTPTLVSTSFEQFEIVRFVAQLIAVIVPMLDHFSMQAAIDANNRIPISLLCGNLVYSGLYVLVALFFALLFFEDRDLA